MKNNYGRLLRIFLLFAFVYLMLCPYAEMLSAAHGGTILIQQDDFRKTKKLVKNDFQTFKNPVLVKNSPYVCPALPENKALSLYSSLHERIGLSIFATVQLLL